MPGVTVEYRTNKMTATIATVIKSAVRSFGARHFSTKEVTLTEASFTFIFQDAGRFGELTDDIIVRVPLHHFPERLAAGSDTLGVELAEFICDALRKKKLAANLTVGVSIPLCEIGWGKASV